MEVTEAVIEKKIQEKGLNAPRLTPDLIDSLIVKKEFHVFPDSCDTICLLTLKNGYTVNGSSACVSPENFNKEIGEDVSFKNARNEIWPLEGYLLKQKLFEAAKA